MTDKWIIENGEIKDTTTNMTFDSFVEIITVLNGQSRRITELASDNKRLKFQLNDCLNKKLFSRRELEKENEQLKEQLSEAKTDEKQLGISFMGYKMKLIEVLQKKYDKVKGKTLYADVYTEIAEEMGVDLE